MIKMILSRNRVFILAILLSFAWHLFWLSAIKVVVAPPKRAPVKFSKVSFLGPILERGAIELGVRPKERSLLEGRYLNDIGDLAAHTMPARSASSEYIPDDRAGLSIDRAIAVLIEDALSGTKIEPLCSVE